METLTVNLDLVDCEILALAGLTIVLVVVVEAQPCQVVDTVVVWIAVKMGDLPLLDSVVAAEPEADTATAPALREYLGFCVWGNLLPLCHGILSYARSLTPRHEIRGYQAVEVGQLNPNPPSQVGQQPPTLGETARHGPSEFHCRTGPETRR